jgi:pyruvate kinase
VTSFRLNMSHTEVKDLERVIRFVQDHTRVPICLDTQGAQIRTGELGRGVTVTEGRRVRIVGDKQRGNASTIPLGPPEAIPKLVAGSRLSIDFDSVIVRLDKVGDSAAEATVLMGGQIGTRKAVTPYPPVRLPTFSEDDLLGIQIALQNDVHEYALSFAEHPDAVTRLRQMVGPGDTIIAKIESREGVRNLGEIALASHRLLIDRGDLSREVRLEAIPQLQKAMIRKANALGVPVYVATNLLESMVSRRTPTRAEVNDVINSLEDGADGLVLAAETAIGEYPVEAARMVAALMREFEVSVERYYIDDLLGEHPLAMWGSDAAGATKL